MSDIRITETEVSVSTVEIQFPTHTPIWFVFDELASYFEGIDYPDAYIVGFATEYLGDETVITVTYE